MICPSCFNPKSRVAETRSSMRFMISRRRECLACGHKFTTYEMHASMATPARGAYGAIWATAFQNRINLVLRDADIAKNLYKGWRLLAEKYGLKRRAIHHAAERGRKRAKAMRK